MPINNYAINLELNLANNTGGPLKDVYTELSKIEEQISKISAAHVVLTDVGNTLDSSLVKVSKSLDGIKTNVEAILPPTLKNDVKQYEEMGDVVAEIDDSYKSINDSSEGIDTSMSNLRKMYPQINNQCKQMEKSCGNSNKIMSNLLNTSKAVNKSLGQQNSNLLGISKSSDKTKDAADRNGRAIIGWTGATINLKDAFMVLGREQELFVTANYRLLGSQVDLAHETRSLTNDFGLLREEALEAYIALAQTKLPKEELMKLSAEVGMFGRITGVSAQQTADFAQRNRMIGLGSEATGRQLKFMANAMRSFGLSSKDIGTLMGGMSDETARYGHLLPKQVEEMEKMTVAMAGLGKTSGVGAEMSNALNKISNSADDASNNAKHYLEAITGVNLTLDEGPAKNLAKTYIALSESLKTLDPNDKDALAAWNAEFSALNINTDHARSFVKAVEAEMKKSGKTFEQTVADMEKNGMSLPEGFKEANQTTQRGFQEAWGRITQVFMKFLDIVAPAIIWFSNYVIMPLIGILEFLTGSTDAASKSFEALGDGIKSLLAPFRLIGAILTGDTKGMAEFAGQTWSLIKGAAALAIGIYALIVAFRLFSAAAIGLRSTLRMFSVRNTAGITIALLGVAAAALGIGYALKQMAAAGAYGVAMLGLLTAGLAVLGVVIAVVAGSGPFGIAACLAIAVALAAVGAAALGVAAALTALALVMQVSIAFFEEFGKFLDKLSIGGVANLALLGGAFYLAAWGIASGSAILMMAIPAIMLGTWILGRTIDKLAERQESLIAISTSLMMLGTAFVLLAASAVGLAEIGTAIKNLNSALSESSSLAALSLQMMLLAISFRSVSKSAAEFNKTYESIAKLISALNDLANNARSFDKMHESISLIAGSLNSVANADTAQFDNNISSIANTLDAYATRIQESAARISGSLNAIKEAQKSTAMPEMESSVSASSIMTVKVTKEEASKQEQDKKQTLAAMKEQTDSINSIRTLLADKMGNSDTVTKILSLLAEHLPKLAEAKPVLMNTGFNNWNN